MTDKKLINNINALAENLKGSNYLDNNDIVILLASIKDADMDVESINGNAYYIVTRLMSAIAAIANAYGEDVKKEVKKFFIAEIEKL